jgi:hypothetical protein
MSSGGVFAVADWDWEVNGVGRVLFLLPLMMWDFKCMWIDCLFSVTGKKSSDASKLSEPNYVLGFNATNL